MHTLRETGTGESERPSPRGDYSGSSRRELMKQLLAPANKQPATEDSLVLERTLLVVVVVMLAVLAACGLRSLHLFDSVTAVLNQI
jgi:hypothetical protein